MFVLLRKSDSSANDKKIIPEKKSSIRAV